MSTRSYDQYCGLGFALDVIGERWAPLVVRELLCGPRRFSDLLAGMPGVATNTLTTRLEELERNGLINRSLLPPPAASAVYALTAKGRGLEPAIIALVRWVAFTGEACRIAPVATGGAILTERPSEQIRLTTAIMTACFNKHSCRSVPPIPSWQ